MADPLNMRRSNAMRVRQRGIVFDAAGQQGRRREEKSSNIKMEIWVSEEGLL